MKALKKIRNTATRLDFTGVCSLFDPQHAGPLLRIQTGRKPSVYLLCGGVADFFTGYGDIQHQKRRMDAQ